jgi:hypothetical protein
MSLRHLLAALVLAVPAAAQPEPAPSPVDHRVGIGLGGVSYYMPYPPFNDLVKTMRWIDVAEWGPDGVPAAAEPDRQVIGRVGVDHGSTYPAGEYTLTWSGPGDVTLDRPRDAELIDEQLNPEGTSRRVYRLPDGPGEYGPQLQIQAFPIGEVHLYIPGGENAGLWNPDYLRVIEPFRGTHIRYMDLGGTNHSQQQTWADRTPLNWASYLVGNHNRSADEPIAGRVPWEAMIQLANATETDMWITVPHLADAEYLTNLAHLIHTGVDRATGEQTTEPLDDDHRVWLEYSNEVWNWNFDQSDWVNENVEGDRLDDRYSRKALEVFNAFEEEFGGTDRLVRIIGTQTNYGDAWRTEQRLAALDPQQDVDAIAITTYFSHDMAQWSVDHWPVTVQQYLDELSRRVGTGPFTTGDEIDADRRRAMQYALAAEAGLPVVAYEGGPHLTAHHRVWSRETPEAQRTQQNRRARVPADELIPDYLAFLQQVERTPRFAEVYRQHLQRHDDSGLAVNTPFVLVAGWRPSGQWGHLESLAQPLDEAPKMRALVEHYGLQPPAEPQ